MMSRLKKKDEEEEQDLRDRYEYGEGEGRRFSHRLHSSAIRSTTGRGSARGSSSRRSSSLRDSIRSSIVATAEFLPERVSLPRLSCRIQESDLLLLEEEKELGKSAFYVSGICCASEIPLIHKALAKLPKPAATGRAAAAAAPVKININVTTKTVYVDHPVDEITTQQISDLLTRQGFSNHILRDANKPSHVLVSTLRIRVHNKTLSTTTTGEDTITLLRKGLDQLVEMQRLESYQLEPQQEEEEEDHRHDTTTTTTTTTRTMLLTVNHCPVNGGMTVQHLEQWLQQEDNDEQQPHGMTCSIVSDGLSELLQQQQDNATGGKHHHHHSKGKNTSMHSRIPRPAVIISGILWVISMLSLLGGNFEHLKWVALVSVAFGIPGIANKAYKTLMRRQFDTNCLMLFASLGAIALQDFTEAAAVVFLFALSEWLEFRATTRARQALSAIVDLRPDTAELIHAITQETLLVPASIVPIGATVSVRSGAKIPCDGIVVDGDSTVDESSLTGESRPIRKTRHSKVSGGTVNSGLAPLRIQTTATAGDSAVARLIQLVEEAQANRSGTEKLVDRFATYYTPIVVVAAICMCTIPWAFGQGEEWTHNGLILIVVACPCALIISTPVCYVAGLTAAAQKGVLIKGGAYLEALRSLKTICFDKTGTLTTGKFRLLELKVFGENTNMMSRSKVLEYLSLMEERASHPLAQAILAAARNEGVKASSSAMKVENHKTINGEGVCGIVNGQEVNVGNERMFARLGLLQQEHRTVVQKWKESLGATVGFMSVGDYGIVCAYGVADAPREEAKKVVTSLKQRNIDLVMLTGDNQDAAHSVGKQIGLDPSDIQSKLLPIDKLNIVTTLSSKKAGKSSAASFFNPCAKKHLVMMCGDGVNDAPALAAAHVGLAMGEGAALSMETSDITLLDSNLEKLEYSVRLGERVTGKIIQNVVFSLVTKFIVLGFALAGKTELWAAIATDVGSMLLVTLNAMALLPRKGSVVGTMVKKGDIEDGKLAAGSASECEFPDLATRESTEHEVTDLKATTLVDTNKTSNLGAGKRCKLECCNPDGAQFCLTASGMAKHFAALNDLTDLEETTTTLPDQTDLEGTSTSNPKPCRLACCKGGNGPQFCLTASGMAKHFPIISDDPVLFPHVEELPVDTKEQPHVRSNTNFPEGDFQWEYGVEVHV